MDPSEDSIKKFKSTIKELTKKSCTFSHEKWCECLNPIIRGKVNYFLICSKAKHEVYKALKDREASKSKYFITNTTTIKVLQSLDAYTRQRLRIALKHKRPKRRDGYLLTHKYNLAFFANMGLVSGEYLFKKLFDESITPLELALKKTNVNKEQKRRYVNSLKDKGVNYYTQKRLGYINACKKRANA